ncbi:hypothetical protein MBLNU230_g8387t2 [Neophaeotheca triangularis]
MTTAEGEPNIFVTKGTTLTSPYVYIQIHGKWAYNLGGTATVATDDWFLQQAPESVYSYCATAAEEGFGQARRVNYADFEWPVPASVYRCQPHCWTTLYESQLVMDRIVTIEGAAETYTETHSTWSSSIITTVNTCSTIWNDYHPILSIPPEFFSQDGRKVVPGALPGLEISCRFDTGTDAVFFDPPIALTPQSQIAGVTRPAGASVAEATPTSSLTSQSAETGNIHGPTTPRQTSAAATSSAKTPDHSDRWTLETAKVEHSQTTLDIPSPATSRGSVDEEPVHSAQQSPSRGLGIADLIMSAIGGIRSSPSVEGAGATEQVNWLSGEDTTRDELGSIQPGLVPEQTAQTDASGDNGVYSSINGGDSGGGNDGGNSDSSGSPQDREGAQSQNQGQHRSSAAADHGQPNQPAAAGVVFTESQGGVHIVLQPSTVVNPAQSGAANGAIVNENRESTVAGWVVTDSGGNAHTIVSPSVALNAGQEEATDGPALDSTTVIPGVGTVVLQPTAAIVAGLTQAYSVVESGAAQPQVTGSSFGGGVITDWNGEQHTITIDAADTAADMTTSMPGLGEVVIQSSGVVINGITQAYLVPDSGASGQARAQGGRGVFTDSNGTPYTIQYDATNPGDGVTTVIPGLGTVVVGPSDVFIDDVAQSYSLSDPEASGQAQLQGVRGIVTDSNGTPFTFQYDATGTSNSMTTVVFGLGTVVVGPSGVVIDGSTQSFSAIEANINGLAQTQPPGGVVTDAEGTPYTLRYDPTDSGEGVTTFISGLGTVVVQASGVVIEGSTQFFSPTAANINGLAQIQATGGVVTGSNGTPYTVQYNAAASGEGVTTFVSGLGTVVVHATGVAIDGSTQPFLRSNMPEAQLSGVASTSAVGSETVSGDLDATTTIPATTEAQATEVDETATADAESDSGAVSSHSRLLSTFVMLAATALMIAQAIW